MKKKRKWLLKESNEKRKNRKVSLWVKKKQ